MEAERVQIILPDRVLIGIAEKSHDYYERVTKHYPELQGDVIVLMQNRHKLALSYMKTSITKNGSYEAEVDDILLFKGKSYRKYIGLIQPKNPFAHYIADNSVTAEISEEIPVAAKDDLGIKHILISPEIKPVTLYSVPNRRIPRKQPVLKFNE